MSTNAASQKENKDSEKYSSNSVFDQRNTDDVIIKPDNIDYTKYADDELDSTKTDMSFSSDDISKQKNSFFKIETTSEQKEISKRDAYKKYKLIGTQKEIKKKDDTEKTKRRINKRNLIPNIIHFLKRHLVIIGLLIMALVAMIITSCILINNYLTSKKEQEVIDEINDFESKLVSIEMEIYNSKSYNQPQKAIDDYQKLFEEEANASRKASILYSRINAIYSYTKINNISDKTIEQLIIDDSNKMVELSGTTDNYCTAYYFATIFNTEKQAEYEIKCNEKQNNANENDDYSSVGGEG